MLVVPDVPTQTDAAGEIRARESRTQPLQEAEPSAAETRLSDLLLLQCRTNAQAGAWGEVERIASSAIFDYPREPLFYTQWAWAVYQQGNAADALEIAAKAAGLFPRSVAVAYSMACLNGALLRISEAKRWLELTVERASNPDKVKLRSLVQPELQCVWSEADPAVRKAM